MATARTGLTARIRHLPVLVVTLFGLFQDTTAFKSSTTNQIRPRLSLLSPGTAVSPLSRHNPSFSSLFAKSKSGDETITLSSPLNNPALAALDILALLGFAAIGKASHAPDGSIDPAAVFVTAFPFITAWIVTSPLTGIYNRLPNNGDENKNVVQAAALQTLQGWALAVPLGCALRGILKGYLPPLPFVIVTLVATLVILGSVRVIYALATTTTTTRNEEP
jgi:Protein of unknown function (DUF3054)